MNSEIGKMKQLKQWGATSIVLLAGVFLAGFIALPSAFASSTDGSIWTSTNSGSSWSSSLPGSSYVWMSATSSSDGTHQALIDQGGYGSGGGYIWTSSDSGSTWTKQTTPGQESWGAITSSSDGTKIAAEWSTAVNVGAIWISTNSGSTWTQATLPSGTYDLNSALAYSADGSTLYASASNTVGDNFIWESTDDGASWTQSSIPVSGYVTGLATTSNGSKVVAVAGGGSSTVYTSLDNGSTWTTGTVATGVDDISMSGDGNDLIVSGSPGPSATPYVSTNGGSSWTQASLSSTGPVAVSSDGSHFFAVVNNDVEVSTNGGSSWSQLSIPASANMPIATSANGSTILVGGTASSGGSSGSSGGGSGGYSGTSNVDSVPTLNGQNATLELGSGCTLSNVSDKASSAYGNDPGYSYPAGMLNFTAQYCGPAGFTTTVTQYYYGAPAGNYVARKFVNGKFQNIPNATVQWVTLNGQKVLEISYPATDGGSLDEDGTANGVLVDPAGPALAPATPNTGYGQPSSNTPTVLAIIAGVLIFAGASVMALSRIRE